jgi:YHS domain-containing protein
VRKSILNLVAGVSLASVALADQTPDHIVLILKTRDAVAVQGYDAVAHFTDHKALKGSPKFRSEDEGTTYFFATAEHKALFDANPAKYAPAYGGYCGYAASIDRLSPISPEWFQIIDGKPTLQHNKKRTTNLMPT